MTKPIQIKNINIGSGIPKICVPLTASDGDALCIEAEKAAEAGADLIEWRADFFRGLKEENKVKNMAKNLADCVGGRPLLFTIRTDKEGGKAALTEEEYETICVWAAESKAVDLVDVEVFSGNRDSLIEKLHREGVFVVASSHDFEKTEPKDALIQRFLQMETTGADILKIAVMPLSFSDTAALMDATSAASERTTRPLISMSMGKTGMVSRVAGESFGSAVTFGTVGEASAPGQLPMEELRSVLGILHRPHISTIK